MGFAVLMTAPHAPVISDESNGMPLRNTPNEKVISYVVWLFDPQWAGANAFHRLELYPYTSGKILQKSYGKNTPQKSFRLSGKFFRFLRQVVERT